MEQPRCRALAVAAALAAAAAFMAPAAIGRAAAEEVSPETTVTRYLAAVKAGKFAEAYDYVSTDMARGKSRDEWAKEQQWVMQASEAKIFEFKVYPGKIEGAKALVPNILSSQDKYLNQLGVEEQELYTLIREDGRWKITQQQLVEKSDIPKWFPAPAAAAKAPEKAAAP